MKFLVSMISFFFILGCEGVLFDASPIGGNDDPCDGIVESADCPLPTSGGVVTSQLEVSMKSRKEIPLVKTVLIVDNSNSMAEEQALLAEGIETFAAQLKGKNVDLYLYTTSQLSASSGKHWVGNRLQFNWDYLIDVNNGNLVNHNFSTEAMTAMKPMSDIKINYSYLNSANAPVVTSEAPGWDEVSLFDMSFEYTLRPNLLENGAALAIRQNMNDEQIATVISKLKASVTSVGTTGDDDEDGLCSLVRLVYEKGQNKIFKEGDSVAFVILTDEDDRTDIKSCVPSQKLTKIKRRSVASTRNCEDGGCTPTHFRYYMRLDYNRLTYSCSQSFDGVLKPVAAADFNIWACAQPGLCQTTATTCSSEQLSLLKNNVSAACRGTITSCEVTVPLKPANQTYETARDVTVASMPAGATVEQYCDRVFETLKSESEYGIPGKRVPHRSTCRYGYGYAYVNTRLTIDSTSDGLKHELNYFTEDQKTKANGATNDKAVLIDAFINKSKEVFGENGFMVSAIMRDPTADTGHTCPTEANANSAFGTTYKTLVERLGAKGTIHSICANDYGLALKKVEDYIKLIAETTLSVSLKPGQKIVKITRIRDGKSLALEFGKDVKVTGAKIEFLRDYDLEDKYQVQLESAQ